MDVTRVHVQYHEYAKCEVITKNIFKVNQNTLEIVIKTINVSHLLYRALNLIYLTLPSFQNKIG